MGEKPQLPPHSLWATGPQGSGDRRSCAQPSGAPEPGKGGGSGRLGKGQGLGRRAGGPAGGRPLCSPPPRPVSSFSVLLTPALCPCPQGVLFLPLRPHSPDPPGDKLSLYLQSLRGLSIYYYGLIIMIIASVDPPPVRLSLLGFPGDPGCGGCTGSHLLAPPSPLPVLSGRQRSGATGWALKPWRGVPQPYLPPPFPSSAWRRPGCGGLGDLCSHYCRPRPEVSSRGGGQLGCCLLPFAGETGPPTMVTSCPALGVWRGHCPVLPQPPAHCPPPAPLPGTETAPEWTRPLLLFAGKSSGGEVAGPPTHGPRSLWTGLPAPSPTPFCIWR